MSTDYNLSRCYRNLSRTLIDLREINETHSTHPPLSLHQGNIRKRGRKKWGKHSQNCLGNQIQTEKEAMHASNISGKKIVTCEELLVLLSLEIGFVGNTTKNRRSAIPHENFTFPNSFKTGQTSPTFCQGFIPQILHVA